MASSTKQLENLDTELDALTTPTSAQVYAVSRDYDADIVAASAAGRAINGGGAGTTQPVPAADTAAVQETIPTPFDDGGPETIETLVFAEDEVSVSGIDVPS